MAYPMGEAERQPLRVDFDRRIKLEFHGARITSDGGLLPEAEPLTRLLVGPGERMEILVDFGADQDGRVTLRAYNSELAARIVPNVIADEWDRTDFDIMGFNVIAPSAAPIAMIPGPLLPLELIPDSATEPFR